MDYQQRVLMAVQGLVPIAMMDLVGKHGRTKEDIIPSDEEREEIVETLAMADGLAAGSLGTKRDKESRGRSLAAVAKAICYGSCRPGGVEFLGRKWLAKEHPSFGIVVEDHDVQGTNIT